MNRFKIKRLTMKRFKKKKLSLFIENISMYMENIKLYIY